MPPKLRGTRGAFDGATMGTTMAGPGMDTRQWVSFGTVDDKSPDDDTGPVFFDVDEFGNAPLVNVTLQPSNIPVRCRVAAQIAGNGEADYHPFISGDEVIVLLAEGSEDHAVIVGRLNNGIDKFPTGSVAGQDPKNNTFAFSRRRTPYVQEYGASYMVRVASHGGFMLLSDSGSWTFRDGTGGALQFGADAFSYMEGTGAVTDGNSPATTSPKAMFQIDLTGRRFTLAVDDALFSLNSSSADNAAGEGVLAVGAKFTVINGTNAAAEHVATTEFVLAALETFALALAPAATAPVALAALAAVIASGGVPLGPTLGAALPAGISLASIIPKPPPAGPVQLAPTLGATLFLVG